MCNAVATDGSLRNVEGVKRDAVSSRPRVANTMLLTRRSTRYEYLSANSGPHSVAVAVSVAVSL